jgi:uncharacterized protein YecA (UPF0149 family)
MARYYTPEQKAEMARWLLELRGIVQSGRFEAYRNRANDLISLLKAHPTHWASEFVYEFERLLNVVRRLERQTQLPGEW